MSKRKKSSKKIIVSYDKYGDSHKNDTREIKYTNKHRQKKLIIYTDGSCVGNGQRNATGGIGVYFPNGELDSISKSYPLSSCTNQSAEMFAILSALRYVRSKLPIKELNIHLYTDSEWSINCLTKWYKGWEKNGWLTQNGSPVKHKKMIKRVRKYMDKYSIHIKWVEGHSGDPGNEEADRLATMATKNAIMNKGTPKKNNRYIPKKTRNNQASNTRNNRVNNTRNNQKSNSKNNLNDLVIELV